MNHLSTSYLSQDSNLSDQQNKTKFKTTQPHFW